MVAAKMNYFELHIGDYAEATAHLSFVEDAAYSRMIRKYYSTEKPLPADLKQVQRLIGARTREEKSAVATVLEEFFFLDRDGWHNARCDAEIEKFVAGEPEREVKKANEENRVKRHREERSALFKALTDAGLHAPWNIGMVELRAMVERLKPSEPVTPPVTQQPLQVQSPVTPPATAPATPATATQYPVPNTQTPDVNQHPVVASTTTQLGGDESQHEKSTPNTRKGELCKKLRTLGIDAAPHMQAWAQLLQAYSDEEIIAAAELARERKPGERVSLNYLVPMLADRSIAKPGTTQPHRKNLGEERAETIAVLTGRSQSHERTAPSSSSERDITGNAERVA